MTVLHKNLTSQKWHSLSFYEQMGNIGSEISRARDLKNTKIATERALELIDLTLSDKKLIKKKEVARVREVLCDTVFGDNQYNTSLEDLNKYFYHFAYAARINK